MLDAQQTPPTTSSNEVVASSVQKVTTKKDDCCDKPGGCGNCMKGGMPMKKEALSFITLFLIGLSTVLGVLLINEKRAELNSPTVLTQNVEVAVSTKYEMPSVKPVSEIIQLPEPDTTGKMSVEEAIQNRRSRRFFSQEPVTMEELSQVLWSAQGITDEVGHRAAASAKGAYPYSLYVVVRNVKGLANGLYLYNPTDNTLGNLGVANAGELLIEAGVQDNSQKAPVVIAMTASFAKMQEKFPDADPKPNTYLEGGHIGQNIYLQVEALNMATVVTGGYSKPAVSKALGLDEANQEVVYLIPFGHIGEAPEVEETH